MHKKHKYLEDYIFKLGKELNIKPEEGFVANSKQFVALIKHCNFIYDRNTPDFKNNVKKDAAWRAIAKLYKRPVARVQLRWRTLREMYSRYKRELLLCPNSNRKVFPYYEDMFFLDPHITLRKSLTLTPETFKRLKEIQEDGDMKLIGEIKSRSAIYLPNAKTEDQQEAWNDVAKIMGRSVHECEMKWADLTRKFKKEQEKMLENATHSNSELYKVLLFLQPYLKVQLSSPSSKNHLRELNCDLKDEVLSISSLDLDKSEVADIPDPSITEESNSQEYIIIEHQSSNEAEFNTNINNLEFMNLSKSSFSTQHCQVSSDSQQQQTNSTMQNNDGCEEDDLFCKTINAELRQIKSRKRKKKIKAEIYKILYDNEYENE